MAGIFGFCCLRGIEHEFVDLAGVGRGELIVVTEGLAFVFVEFADEGVDVGVLDSESLKCRWHSEHG